MDGQGGQGRGKGVTTYSVCNTEEDGRTRRIGKGKGGDHIFCM